MAYELRTTEPAGVPISAEDAKKHAQVEHTDDDGYIALLIQAATNYAENYTGRAFFTQTLTHYVDAFPITTFKLQRRPILSVASVTYVDANGATQTLAASQYKLSIPQGIVERANGVSWPATRLEADAVLLAYVAGYGDQNAIPQALRQAIAMIVAHWYEARVPIVTGTIVAKVPLHVESILDQYRIYAV